MAASKYLSALTEPQRHELEQRLLNRQNNRCFICDELIDLTLHAGQLDIDHIDPIVEDGLDAVERSRPLFRKLKPSGNNGKIWFALHEKPAR